MQKKAASKSKTKASKKTFSKGKYKKWLEPEGLIILGGWARDGLTNEQMAQNMGITRKTFQEWCVKYSDISDAVKKGKEVVDIQVENALLKRALGYMYDEVKEEIESGAITKRTITRKEVVADTTAQIFWLKNRRPDKWRNREEVEVVQEDKQQVDMHKATLVALKDRTISNLLAEDNSND